MLRVGLTGGIASGKSTVAAELTRRGAVVVDADLLAREVVEPGTPALAAIVERFGRRVLDGDRLNRAALGTIVFADPDARRDLEAIVHPAVRARARAVELEQPADAVVVHVIPLLVETGQRADFDLLLVVDTDHETQVARLGTRNGLSPADAERRIAAQATRAQRLAAADIVIDNTGAAENLTAQIDRIWAHLQTVEPRS